MSFLFGIFAIVTIITYLCECLWLIALALKILNVEPVNHFTYGQLFLYLLGLVCINLVFRFLMKITAENI